MDARCQKCGANKQMRAGSILDVVGEGDYKAIAQRTFALHEARKATPKPEPKSRKLPREFWKHGTYSCYSNHNCRCPECRVAAREWQRAWRERRRAS